MPIFIPTIPPKSPSSIIWNWYTRSVTTAVPIGNSLTPLRITDEWQKMSGDITPYSKEDIKFFMSLRYLEIQVQLRNLEI
jgi:hypothetical protein